MGAAVAGGSLVSQILVFRPLELVGVVLLMVSLPPLARRLGNDPGLALWLGVLTRWPCSASSPRATTTP